MTALKFPRNEVMRVFSFFIILILNSTFSAFAEKVLIYDEEKGIIFVDPKEKSKSTSKTPNKKKKTTPVKRSTSTKKVVKPTAKTDLHLNRKKDPPDLYFKSGLKYYQNGNFTDALKNFKHASDKSLKPEYLLWIGKTYRKLHRYDQMQIIMKRIVKDYSDSDVADDALFEMAFYHQTNNRYSKAMVLYKQLAEKYPFGLSYSNGDEFLEISRKERQRMRGEILSALPALGIKAETLEEGYSLFQKLNNLKVTSKGDSITVTLIRQQFNELSKNVESISKTRQSLRRNLRWVLATGFISLFFFILMTIIFLKLNRYRKEISLMTETLSDMRLVKK